MSRILIVGTNHRYQREASGVTPDETRIFRDYLRQVVTDSAVVAIAEEMSRAALAEHDLASSVAKDLADELGLAHDLSDPEPDEREKLGIINRTEISRDAFLRGNDDAWIEREVRRSYDIREHHWVSRLEYLDAFPLLFICGAEHVRPLEEKLAARGYDVSVLAERWEAA